MGFTDATVKANNLYSVEGLLLPGAGVCSENRAVNIDSPLSGSMNLNEKERIVGATMNAERADVESSSSMSIH